MLRSLAPVAFAVLCALSVAPRGVAADAPAYGEGRATHLRSRPMRSTATAPDERPRRDLMQRDPAAWILARRVRAWRASFLLTAGLGVAGALAFAGGGSCPEDEFCIFTQTEARGLGLLTYGGTLAVLSIPGWIVARRNLRHRDVRPRHRRRLRRHGLTPTLSAQGAGGRYRLEF